MKIFFDCLKVVEGGQITRANSFINNKIWIKEKSNLIILKSRESKLFELRKSIFPKNKIIFYESNKFIPIKKFIKFLTENIFVNYYISKSKADIYLSFSNYLPLIKPNIPIILGVSTLAPFSKEIYLKASLKIKIKLLILKVLIINSCNKANKVIALSEKCKNSLIKAGIKKSKIHVINNGLEKNIFNKSFKDFSTKKYILYVSHFYNYKNHSVLIKAFSLLPKDLKDCYELVLVGNFIDKDYFKNILNMTKELDLKNNIKFKDNINHQEIKTYYKNATLFIFPSLIENCPNILLEAMSYGLPIICSNTEPMPEFGRDALEYFNPHNHLELSKKIYRLLTNENDLISLSKQSKEQSKRFSWDNFSEEVLTLCCNFNV